VILLNPGPVNLSDRVRAALAGPDLCHREPEFAALQGRVRERLLAVYRLDPERWAAIVLTGSGTTALEAMIASLTSGGGQLLVLANGVYGERAAEIAQRHGLPCETQSHDWRAPVDLRALERRLAGRQPPSHVVAVHHETTTGRLNDLAGIGAVCRRHGVRLLVDAVSSFGAEAIDFEGWGVTACAATANKCLHGAPGSAFVIAAREALPTAERPAVPPTLDLGAHCRAQDAEDTAFTPAIPSLYALDEALAEHAEQGGWRARHDRYAALAARVAEGFAGFGIESLLPAPESSVVLRAYRQPEGLDYASLHDDLKSRGFVIYAGQGVLSGRAFRIANMGEVDAAAVDALVSAVGDLLARAAARLS